jgi:ATP-binding cassette subfamily F protein 3
VNSFVNKVLEIRDGRATLFLGNVDDYLAARKRLEETSVAQKQLEKGVEKRLDGDSGDRKAQRRERAQRRRQLSSQLKPWKKKVAEAETQIETLEVRKEELETLMADPNLYADQQLWSKTSKEYSELQRRLERRYEKWEQAQGRIEEIEAQG